MGEFLVIDSGSTDEALLAGMAMGDQSAAVVFVRRYQRRIFGLAYSMTNDASVSEEVAQEALIRVWRHAPGVRPSSRIGHFVGTDHHAQSDHRCAAHAPGGADGSR